MALGLAIPQSVLVGYHMHTKKQEKNMPQRFHTDTVHDVSRLIPQAVTWDEM